MDDYAVLDVLTFAYIAGQYLCDMGADVIRIEGVVGKLKSVECCSSVDMFSSALVH